jgi:hypothetical protein
MWLIIFRRFLLCLFFICISNVYSDENSTSPIKNVLCLDFLSLGGGAINLRSETLNSLGIKQTGGFNMGLGMDARLFNMISVGFEWNILFTELLDERPFEAAVEVYSGGNYFGSIVDTSSIDAGIPMPLSMDIGYTHSFLLPNDDHLDLDGRVGFTTGINATRGIPACSDCPSQSVDVDGGVYLRPIMTFSFTSLNNFHPSLACSFSYYLSGGYSNVFYIGFSMGYYFSLRQNNNY